MKDKTDLIESTLFYSQALAGHILHDMASPLSALLAGIELIQEQSFPDREVMGLLEKSSIATKARLELLRALYGTGGQTLGLKEAQRVAQNYFDLQGKVSLEWKGDQKTFGKGIVQLLLNVLFWIFERIPKGGKIFVSYDEQEIHVSVESVLILLKPQDEDTLKGNIQSCYLQPQVAQCYMIYLLTSLWKQHLHFEKPSLNKLMIRLTSL